MERTTISTACRVDILQQQAIISYPIWHSEVLSLLSDHTDFYFNSLELHFAPATGQQIAPCGRQPLA